jgi:hypothetical protein
MCHQGDPMTSDEQAIRYLVVLWHSATASGDVLVPPEEDWSFT